MGTANFNIVQVSFVLCHTYLCIRQRPICQRIASSSTLRPYNSVKFQGHLRNQFRAFNRTKSASTAISRVWLILRKGIQKRECIEREIRTFVHMYWHARAPRRTDSCRAAIRQAVRTPTGSRSWYACQLRVSDFPNFCTPHKCQYCNTVEGNVNPTEADRQYTSTTRSAPRDAPFSLSPPRRGAS